MGKLIRIALVVGWLALFGYHIVRHALPGLGVDERRDLAATVAEHLDRTLRYDVIHQGKESESRIGWCEIAFARDDEAFRLTTRLELDTLPFLPAEAQLHGLSRTGRKGGALSLMVAELLDSRCRLAGLEAEGRLFGTSGKLEGVVDHRGFVGSIRIDDQPLKKLTLPDLPREAVQGFETALGLPPGLKVGDRFKSRLLGMDLASLMPEERIAIYVVEAEESLVLGGQVRPALRVSMTVNDRSESIQWCDRRGTILRTRLLRAGIRLDLVRETEAPVDDGLGDEGPDRPSARP